MTALHEDAAVVAKMATILSGAPFPSKRSLAKVEAILRALDAHLRDPASALVLVPRELLGRSRQVVAGRALWSRSGSKEECEAMAALSEITTRLAASTTTPRDGGEHGG